MITEPELSGASGPERPVDLVSDTAGSVPGGGRRRPWWWALGGVVVASAVWGAVLQGTGYGHTAAPDLHGYHISDGLCAAQNLQPLTDAISTGYIPGDTPVVDKGAALDHFSCDVTASMPKGDGWKTVYDVRVTVDLHKKTDPRAEFADISRLLVPADAFLPSDDVIFVTDPHEKRVPVTGIGDRAVGTSGTTRQALTVLHGGAVISLNVRAATVWGEVGDAPGTNEGTTEIGPQPDISGLTATVTRTVRHVMRTLSTTP
ncbi:hypothetical protein OG552_23645 [Streptomyces sp. NBC_01476]|uniref:hypothetical protein n=1 Tax=Streptomyces sp. NBC_01476 TaxID=2903881 RepID=UPI002E33C2F9|nr:hypothetical protein [Streptomyces sp. NBC_01476]